MEMVKTGESSKYVFTELSKGFTVSAPGRTTVEVVCDTFGLLVFSDGDECSRHFGFYEYYSFSDAVARGLMRGWEAPLKTEKEKERGHPAWDVKSWAVKQTAENIGRRVHAQWKRLLMTVDPNVLAVHRAIFAATFGAADVLMDPELYKNKYLVADIMNFRAAAIAVAFVDALSARLVPQVGYDDWTSRQERVQSARLSFLENWRGLFAPDGKSYRSLDRTLSNLPGGVYARGLLTLPQIELKRPIFDNVEMNVLTCCYDCAGSDGFAQKENLPLFLNANRAQIEEGLRRVSEHTHNALRARQLRDRRFFVLFLRDFPERHRGRLVGLVDKSIHWHRFEREQEAQRIISELGGKHKVRRPEIALPENKDLRFLATVEDICAEGSVMQNCIASYAIRAVRGDCYLFHAEHNGEMASIEVSPSGRVVQAHGVRNQRNDAAQWAKRVLNRWGKPIAAAAAIAEEKRKAEFERVVVAGTEVDRQTVFSQLIATIQAQGEDFLDENMCFTPAGQLWAKEKIVPICNELNIPKRFARMSASEAMVINLRLKGCEDMIGSISSSVE